MDALVGDIQIVTPDRWLWLMPAAPALAALLLVLAGPRLPRRAVHALAIGAMAVAAIAALAATSRLVALPAEARFLLDRRWEIVAVGAVRADLAFALDPLSAVMVLVVTLVGTAIFVYAAGYMHHERTVWRFFAALSLFVAAMLVLVLADSFLLLFFGWEGVGLCSYLLIGYWYRDADKAAAGGKAFVMNRVGDWGFLVGLLLLFWGLGGAFALDRPAPEVANAARTATVQDGDRTVAVPIGPTLSFRELGDQLALGNADGIRPAVELLRMQRVWGMPLLFLIGLALFVGVAGKSAQIPLYTWLPDAMAGPTPVSALIHAATMVTAGVYLLARLSFLFSLSPETMTLVATAGLATAFLGAVLALFPHDIKRVLAYSTVSQLGLMVLAAGVGAYGAAVFHLVTHACFKACLFLSAGSVIHGVRPVTADAPANPAADPRLSPDQRDPQDLRNMGGLAGLMPRTRLAYLLGCVAIAGFPIAAGFYSKDEILWRAFTQENTLVPGPLLGALALACAGLTAFYMFRTYYLAFQARTRGEAVARRIHESPRSMTAVLTLLAGASVVSGAILGWPEAWGGHPALERFLSPVFALASTDLRFTATPAAAMLLVQAAALALAFAGWALARTLYRDLQRTGDRLARWRARWDRLHRFAYRGFRVDDLQRELAVHPVLDLARWSNVLDRRLVDGVVNGLAASARALAAVGGWIDHVVVDGAVRGVSAAAAGGGRALMRLQTGRLNNYLLGIAVGVITLAVVTWLAG